MKKTLLFLILFLMIQTGWGEETLLVPDALPPTEIRFISTPREGQPPCGIFVTTAGLPFIMGGELSLMDAQWRQLDRAEPGKIVRRIGDTESVEELISESPFWSQSITIKSHGNPMEVEWQYSVKPNAIAKYLQLKMSIPKGMLIEAPAAHGVKPDNLIIHGPTASYKLTFSDEQGRTYFENWSEMKNVEEYQLKAHLPFDPEQGCSGKAVLRVESLPSRKDVFMPIPLAPYGNRDLDDETANDQSGGWTDEGPNNLKCFSPGFIYSCGVPFLIGNRAIILKSAKRLYFPDESPSIPMKDICAEILHFCHTVTWGGSKGNDPIFSYMITYADDSQERCAVINHENIQDWWSKDELPDARVAWTGFNGMSTVSLYHARWQNPHPDRPIRSIRVVSAVQQPIPVVLAVTAQQSNILDSAGRNLLSRAFKATTPPEILDTSGWFECRLDWQGKIEPQSVLDLSALNPKPAGIFGFLKTTPDGHFAFEKQIERKIRFWGSNIAIEGPFPPKDCAPGIAKTLAAQGANLIRLHLYGKAGQDAWSHMPPLINENGTVNEEMIDRMQFFMAELKKNGIYMLLDWNSGLMWSRLCGRPISSPAKEFISLKKASIFNRELIAGTKRFAELVFTNMNPYTGLSILNDPAVALLEITNENTLTMSHHDIPFHPDDPYAQELGQLWLNWQKEHGVDSPAALKGLPNVSMGTLGRRFFAELQKAHYDEMKAFLIELGAKVPICGTTWAYNNPADPWSNRDMDYLCDHGYYSGGPKEGKLSGPIGPSVVNSNLLTMPFFNRFPQSRIEGKPYIIGEWNFNFPGNFRCEGMPLMAAYACLHDWDAILFYCTTGSFNSGYWELLKTNEPRILSHTQHFDPSTWGLAPAAALAYRRGDFSTARNSVTLIYTPDDVFEHRRFGEQYPFLTAMTRVVSKFPDKEEPHQWPVGAPRDSLVQSAKEKLGIGQADQNAIFSDTAELKRFAAPGLFVAQSERTEMATGAISTMTRTDRQLKAFHVQSAAFFASIAFSSLDGKALGVSSRILVTLVGNSRNKTDKMVGNVYNAWGEGPPVTEPLRAEISWNRVDDRTTRAYAIDPTTGQRRHAIDVESDATRESFIFDSGQEKTIYVELARMQ